MTEKRLYYMFEDVIVLDKELKTLWEGKANDAVDWIVANPVEPHKVKLEWTKEPVSIDDFLTEWDRLCDGIREW